MNHDIQCDMIKSFYFIWTFLIEFRISIYYYSLAERKKKSFHKSSQQNVISKHRIHQNAIVTINCTSDKNQLHGSKKKINK